MESDYMLRWRKRIRKLTYIMADILCIIIGLICTQILYHYVLDRSLATSKLELIGFLSISIICYMILLLVTSVYDDAIKNQGSINKKFIVKIFLNLTVASFAIGAILFYMNVPLSRLFIFYFVIIVFCFLVFNKFIMGKLGFKYSDKNQLVRNILVIGQSEKGRHYIEEIRKHNYLYFNIVGYVHIKKPNTYQGLLHLGGLEELDTIVDRYVIDEIAVARPLSYDTKLIEKLNHCQDRGITITMLLDLQNEQSSKTHVAMIGTIPVLKFHTASLDESQLYAKRILDIIGSLVGMVFFGVAFIFIGPLIKLETPGPIIFKQKRVGKNGRIFEVWKFRSMGVNAETQKEALLANNEMSGHMFKLTDDPRVTKVGAFIRKTSIDELPQFYNVLKGDMSLVGTRPPTINEVQAYERHHHKRICITPGITGNWQVNGRSDIEDFEEVVKLDSDYIANWSIGLDLKILLKTFLVVVKRKGSK